tara:strand:- start:118 stop:405 length:288 start_codon:yes stop_codon:yes gene_type:complete
MEEEVKVHLRVGDLLHNPKNGAFGWIVKVTRHYFYFCLMSKTFDQDRYAVTSDKASKQKVYENIDKQALTVHLGSAQRRRKRKAFFTLQDEGDWV